MMEKNMKKFVREYMGEDIMKKIGSDTYKAEFKWWDPETPEELEFFYKVNRGYLVHNSKHRTIEGFEDWNRKRVLDYGGGAGIDSYTFIMRGNFVDYYDPNLLQTDFMKWLKLKYNFNDLVIMDKFYEIDKYDLIILHDVLEHCHDQNGTMRMLMPLLKDNGMFYINAPFSREVKPGMYIHFHDQLRLKEYLERRGFDHPANYLWRKVKKREKE